MIYIFIRFAMYMRCTTRLAVLEDQQATGVRCVGGKLLSGNMDVENETHRNMNIEY